MPTFWSTYYPKLAYKSFALNMFPMPTTTNMIYDYIHMASNISSLLLDEDFKVIAHEKASLEKKTIEHKKK